MHRQTSPLVAAAAVAADEPRSALGLAARWRALAETLAPYAEAAARAFEHAANDLEHALRAEANALLSLDDAAAESGYSAAHLSRRIREGTIPNAGRRNKPLIRRGDLPRRAAPLHGRRDASILGASNRQVALSVLNSTSERQDG